MWLALTILSLAALAVLHFWWQRRWRQLEAARRSEVAALQQQQAQALARERTQAEALFNSMAEGFLLLDASGRVQMTNRAFKELFGVNGEVQGRTVLEVLRLHELADIVARLAKEPRVLGHEFKLGDAGAERFIEVNAAAILDAAGGQHGAILVFHDLTRLKRLEQASSDFVANVSHELRTPLSMIKGYIETLLGGAKDDPTLAAKFLQTIERHSNRLELLIEDLLTSSELESGRARLDLRSVPLRPLVDKVLEDFASRAAAREVRLINQTPEITVNADPDRLQQVFGNLIDNAIKYGALGGQVTVNAREMDPDRIEVAVADDGPGLPPEAVSRVFERFFRVDKARSREQGGTGLGLSIVRDIVQRHGGTVRAESKPGQGSTFFLTLPKGAAKAEQAGLL